jgi:hypothetical protein
MRGRKPALAALDSFVAVTLDRLGVPADRRRLLERERIDYLFVPPDWVEFLAGAPTVGVANLQLDVVVTHHPCHFHELAHILVNFWLEELPLFTLPLLQEGVAVHLGGRWGRAPDFLAHVGRFTLESGFVTLPSLLTWEGFHRQGADLTYAPAGVVAGWVLKRAGSAGLEQIYRRLSGNPGNLQAITEEDIAESLGKSLGLTSVSEGEASASRLTDAFTAYLETLPRNPLRPAPRRPYSGQNPDTGFAVVNDDSLVVFITSSDTDWQVRVLAEHGASLRGALLLLPHDGAAVPSDFFAEHFPDGDAPPAVAALRFSPDEAGWYDYTRDLLLAKHIASFWPDPSYHKPGDNDLLFMWPRDLLPWDLADYRLEVYAEKWR